MHEEVFAVRSDGTLKTYECVCGCGRWNDVRARLNSPGRDEESLRGCTVCTVCTVCRCTEAEVVVGVCGGVGLAQPSGSSLAINTPRCEPAPKELHA